MDKLEALQAVLNDPSRSEGERRVARQALDKLGAGGVLEQEVLSETRKARLADVDYGEIQRFCSSRDFRKPGVQRLFDRWLETYLTDTKEGTEQANRMAGHLRAHDFGELKGALQDWKDSDWKSCKRLTAAYERIVAGTSHHSQETVDQANEFLTELRRRFPE
jgi:hypothetical protein